MTIDTPLLIVVAGPARGQVATVDRATSIGRETSSSLCIADLALSRLHCVIELDRDIAVIRDLDSRNGTFVNGVPIREHALAYGDQIRAGDSAFLYVAAAGAPSAGECDGGAPVHHDLLEHSTVVASAERMDAYLWKFPPVRRPVLHSTEASTRVRLSADVTIRHALVGESAVMQDVYRRIARAAPTDATILIRGESGTGKELVARAIHNNSARATKPFVAINCAALPEGLLESELFGHEKGAFTGAVAQKRGRLELANGGTVFFDEVSEIAPVLQAKLLRVLQEREVEHVGGSRSIPVDLRVVAATNRDLDVAVKAGAFRQDLYFRLNVVSIAVPPLRERVGDVSLLIPYFVNKHAARCARRVRGVTRQARECLLRYDWPGNVRELENAIEHAVVLGTGAEIELEDLPEHLLEEPLTGRSAAAGYHAAVNDAKRQLIEDAIERAAGSYAQAARLLALQPTYLHRLIRKLGIRKRT